MADLALLCVCGHDRGTHAWTTHECLQDVHLTTSCQCKAFVRPIPNVDTTATRAVHDQPPPNPEDASKPAVWPLVIVDMCERDRVGRARYGTPLQPNNGRDALKDAYQEALDLAAYLRQAIYERDGK
jgi:hypothetical protein